MKERYNIVQLISVAIVALCAGSYWGLSNGRGRLCSTALGDKAVYQAAVCYQKQPDGSLKPIEEVLK